VFGLRLSDGTQLAVDYQQMQEMLERGDQFEIISQPDNPEVTPIICPTYAAEESSSVPQPSATSSYQPPSTYLGSLVDLGFHKHFFSSIASQLVHPATTETKLGSGLVVASIVIFFAVRFKKRHQEE
jgi:hypothetical protein